MKPIDEIKKALSVCAAGENCECPYFDDDKCRRHIAADALEVIKNLEERIAIMEEGDV